MCASNMRLVSRQLTTQVPGTSKTRTTPVKEWVCPDCDYFEEAESEEDAGIEPEGR